VYGVNIQAPGGRVKLFDIWSNWLTGKNPEVVVSASPGDADCVSE
jgi:hypothetical protein